MPDDRPNEYRPEGAHNDEPVGENREVNPTQMAAMIAAVAADRLYAHYDECPGSASENVGAWCSYRDAEGDCDGDPADCWNNLLVAEAQARIIGVQTYRTRTGRM